MRSQAEMLLRVMSESMAVKRQGSMSVSMTQIREHRDVPGQGGCQGSPGYGGAVCK